MRDTTSRGDLSELDIATALMRAGRRVLRPLSNNSRYDLVVDNEDGTFLRIQCKTGRLRGGCVVFRLHSVSGHTTRQIAYHGQTDAFGIYCPQTREAYLVPMEALAKCRATAYLRVAPSKNGQVRRTGAARDFLISS